MNFPSFGQPNPNPGGMPQGQPAGQNSQPGANGTPNPAGGGNAGLDLRNPNAGGGSMDSMPGGANSQPGGTGSPLDGFTDLFKVDPNKQPTANPLSEKLFNLDPAKLAAAVAKMDFTRSIDPATIQKALSGDVGSFNTTINTAVQGAVATVFQHMTGMMEGAFNKNNERFSSVLDGRFRDYQVNSSTTNHPALKHPAAQPALAAIRSHIASQEPNLSAAQVNDKAEKYFISMGEAINSYDDSGQLRKKGSTMPGGVAEPDYSAFLNL